jgi:DnaA family protein
MQPQLLDLFDSKPTFNSFIPLSNHKVVTLLSSYSSQFTHIVGAPQSGKTHLLTAWVNSAPDVALFIDNPLQINLREIVHNYQYIAIDNIQNLDDNKQIELFDLFNQIKLNNLNNQLLTSSSMHLDTKIREDLKTRILSGINLPLKALSDNELMDAVDIFTAKEGITLDVTEKSYLINHYTRNLGVLIKTIHKITEAAIIEKRNITIPFIKQVLNN